MRTIAIRSSPRFWWFRGRIVCLRRGVGFSFCPISILCILLALSACDLSVLTGGGKGTSGAASGGGSTSGSSGSGGGTTSLITSFAFLASKNSALSSDEVATISAPNLYITLPYNVIQNQTSLTPTAMLQSGYSLTNPSGAFVPTDGMTLVITNLSNQNISNYTLHVSVDPGSIAFLQLASPFYYDTHGIRQALSTSQYTLALAGTTNTYTLALNTDAFAVPYNVNVVQAIVAGQSVGFATASVPYGSFTTNLGEALGGGVTPYTITVQSPSKTVTNTFTIQATRTKSNVVQLTDVSATIAYLYNQSTTQALADSTLQNWLNSEWQPSSSDTYGTNWGGWWSGGNGPQWLSNNATYTANSGPWNGSVNGYSYTDSYVTPQSQLDANNAAIESVPAAPVNTLLCLSSPTTIDLGTSYTLSNSSISANAPAISPVTTPINVQLSFSAVMQVFWGGKAMQDGCPRNISVPLTLTQTFTPANYVQYLQIVVKIPLCDSIQQVAPATFVSSWTQAQNSTDTILTFNFTSTTSKITGVVAQLQIAAETGNVSTYSLAIN